jgi:flagellar hook-length control protein FliK
MTWMANQGLESASLKLSPEHLGPLEIHISVRDGDASVWFGATQPDTRAAIEQALPRLRQMFASQGLTLADAGVSRESPRQQSKTSSSQGVAAMSNVGGADLPISAAMRVSLGLLDTYA